MLCRVLLTAAVVSCTLSREITAHTQAQQRLVQIKDLICVLLLSGLHKEDLDTNTLKKLQRHNVNISAMDDVNVRQECIAKAIFEYQNRNTEAQNTDEDHNKTLRHKETYEVKSTGGTNDQNYHETMDLESVIKYATNRQISVPQFDDIEDMTTKQTEKHNNHIQNDFKEELINNSDEMRRMNGMPDYQNLMSLLKKYGGSLDNTKPTTNRPPTTHNDIDLNFEHSGRRIDKFSNAHALEVEYMSRMLEDYMSNTKGVTTTTLKSIPKETFLRSDSNPFESWISESDTKSFLFEPKYTATKRINPDFEKLKKKYIDDIINVETKQIDKLLHTSDKSNNKSLHITINDIMMLKENFKLFPVKHVDQLDHEDEDVYDVYSIRGTRFRSNTPEAETITEITTTIPLKSFEEQTTALPVNIIKEIAESVKAFLLQDIRKEITNITQDTMTSRRTSETTTTTTTSSSTTTTTLSTTTTTPTTPTTTSYTTTTTNVPTTTTSSSTTPSSTTAKTTTALESTTEQTTTPKSDEKLVIEKFMELFQQMKNTQEKMTIPTTANYKITEKNDANGAHEALGYAYNPYGNNMIFRDLYPPKPMTFGLQSRNPSVIQNIPISNIPYHPPAITLQTNLNEIPPLGIPVSKQMSLINQNIIVTTKNPYAVPIKPKSNIIDHSRDFLYKHENKTKEGNWRDKTRENPPKHGIFKDATAEKNGNSKLPPFVDLSKRERINPIQDAYNDALVNRNRNNVNVNSNPKQVEENDTPMRIPINNIASVRDRNDMLLKLYSGFPKGREFENPIRDTHWSAHRDEARFYTKNRERANLKGSSSRWNNHYRSRFEIENYDRTRPRHENIKRFHEQLEKYEWPRNSRDPVIYRDSSRKERPAPRQQQPLTKVKKSSYDDTHFKNFLNTQQKVNDMLETILATKNKFDGVHSTESV